jgi:hypothetical protein
LPQYVISLFATTRVTASAAAPAEKGTMMRTGLAGYSAANALGADTLRIANSASAGARFIGASIDVTAARRP